jgi:hypothetical protein
MNWGSNMYLSGCATATLCSNGDATWLVI